MTKPSRQWSRSLPDLLQELRREAFELGAMSNETMREQDGDFAWRVLPNGIAVCLRVRDDLGAIRRELRFAKKEPHSVAGEKRFLLEAQTILKQLEHRELDGRTPADARGQCYVRMPNTKRDEGRLAVRFVELLVGEISPTAARCHRCHKSGVFNAVPFRPGDAISGQHCVEHAEFSLDDRERARAAGAL